MKKALFTFAIVLLSVAAQAQTVPFKIHSSGQLSLQGNGMQYGIQIPSSGVASFEPSVTTNYGRTAQTKVWNRLVKSWIVKSDFASLPNGDVFYVLGNGNVYSYGQYILPSHEESGSKNDYPIENATMLLSSMKGYYFDSDEFEGIDPEGFYDNENVSPEAIDGLLKDLEKDKSIGMKADELEEVLPEAVRHTCDGKLGINYDALVPVLIEAFKEQQARIDELEGILRNSGLLDK